MRCWLLCEATHHMFAAAMGGNTSYNSLNDLFCPIKPQQCLLVVSLIKLFLSLFTHSKVLINSVFVSFSFEIIVLGRHKCVIFSGKSTGASLYQICRWLKFFVFLQYCCCQVARMLLTFFNPELKLFPWAKALEFLVFTLSQLLNSDYHQRNHSNFLVS